MRPASGPTFTLVLPPTFCQLVDLLAHGRISVLTGAGCSTESGIPDYRGPDARRGRPRPIFFQEFVRDPETRRRYWARSAVGWTRVERARPNPAHLALARLEAAGRVRGLITQNVDGLHLAAGSRSVVELHGTLSRVRCLECRATESRAAVQRRLLALNPGWKPRRGGSASGVHAARADQCADARGEDPAAAPDGDAMLSGRAVASFRVAGCRRCGGVLKPDVVFFGENVPPERLAAAWEAFEAGQTLLVVGSSLAVYSGYRFVERAAPDA